MDDVWMSLLFVAVYVGVFVMVVRRARRDLRVARTRDRLLGRK